MDPANIQKPKFAIIYAYILTIGSLLGLLTFLVMYLAGEGLEWMKAEISPVVMAITIFIVSCLGLVTGSGLLGRKKYGWMLTQFLFIYLILKIIHGLFLMIFVYYQNLTTPANWGFSFLKFIILLALISYFLFYFNQKAALNYYKVEKDEAYRIYLLSFLTSIMVIFFNVFLELSA